MTSRDSSLFITTMYPRRSGISLISSNSDLSRLIDEVKKAQIQVNSERAEINSLLSTTRYTKERIERLKSRKVNNTSFRNVANSLIKTTKYKPNGKFLFYSWSTLLYESNSIVYYD